ncbi:hypothetical protein PC111_g17894 [Phytophthora cactorum]|nr:hypothetical protein PC111_g17894 [Phytophthora cactorum]KAG3007935.1 hypothetical protein PC120_g16552 [Phytophthora cactorum]KAG3085089.1 hypothetical protein PC122_g9848 [Phytophthora cactorum]
MPPSKNVIVMPTLELERYDEKMMQELAATLLQQNLDQYSELAVTPDGHPDSRSWASIQKREGVRVYKESSRQQQQQIKAQAATGNSAVKTAKVPPSLLLMGTIKGNLDDVLYATAASSTEAMLTKSKYTDDGVVDAKVLARIIEPTMADPMHFLNVTWRYYALSEPRDYVCLDVAGWGNTARGEQVAYHLIHSVGFDALPSYEHKGIARANLSVCWIFRQRTATLVECYARGYYDFDTTNAMLNSLSMHTIASQWLSCVKLVSYAQSLKLSRLLNCGKGTVSSDGSESDSGDGGFGSYGNNSNPLQSQTMSSSTSSSSSSVVLLPAPPEPARSEPQDTLLANTCAAESNAHLVGRILELALQRHEARGADPDAPRRLWSELHHASLTWQARIRLMSHCGERMQKYLVLRREGLALTLLSVVCGERICLL